MLELNALLLLTVAPFLATTAAAVDTVRPRGVAPEFAKFYKDPNTFTCISDPTHTLPRSRVNDDYCDCADGSDEPGTAACSHLSAHSPRSALGNGSAVALALPGFWCKNKGHRGAYVPFQHVNDGVCDYEACCDGSEEWARVGGGKGCPDRCAEMGREWVRMEGERARAGEAAARRRAELVVEAQRARVGVEERVRDLEVNVQAVEEKVRGAEAALKEVEARERSRVVRGGGEGGGVAVLAGLAKERVEELRETLVQVRTQRDEGLRRLRELAALLTTFKEEYNPNFNDEGVKRAVRAWEEYAARPAESADDGFEQDLAEIVKPDSETEEGIKWEEWATPEETETDLLYKFEEYLPKTLRDWINNRLYDLRTMLVDNGILAASTPSGSESAAVTTARASLKAAQDEVSGLRTQLQSHRDDLAKDHGRDGVFRALKGRCISTEEGEYTYELCWLGTTKQKPKKGGADTTMGTFARFDTLQVDDDVPADGKGVGSGERVVLRYEHGQSCWNGPSRSTAVVLACAEEDEIWRVVEEEKCVYRMDVGTPAVCDGLGGNGGGGKGAGTAKDEL